MSEIWIREARPSDAPVLWELIRGLARYEKAEEKVFNTVDNLLQDGFGPNPVFRAWLAGREQPMGFALVYPRYSTWKGRVLYLEDLFVLPEFRGLGLGKMLFEQVLAVAATENYRGLAFQVLDWNQPAIAFYERLGARFDPEWWNGFVDLPSGG